ncbi:hypothetical protein LMG33810_001329 [Carnimonas sp. LMG 33810]
MDSIGKVPNKHKWLIMVIISWLFFAVSLIPAGIVIWDIAITGSEENLTDTSNFYPWLFASFLTLPALIMAGAVSMLNSIYVNSCYTLELAKDNNRSTSSN